MMVGMMDMSADMKKAVFNKRNTKYNLKTLLIFIFCFILFISICGLAFAHSGRLDESGGHWDHSTGTYHYHTGENAGKKQNSSNSDNEYDYFNDEKAIKYQQEINNKAAEISEKNGEIFKLDKELTKVKEKQAKQKKIYITVIALLVFLIVVLICVIMYNKKTIKDLAFSNKYSSDIIDENKKLKHKDTQTSAILKDLYQNYRLNNLAGVPGDIYLSVENNKLCVYDEVYPSLEYGRYTGYVTPFGECFHSTKGCSGADLKVCLLDKDLQNHKKPCSICQNKYLDDTLPQIPTWAITYQNLVEYAKENNIKYNN